MKKLLILLSILSIPLFGLSQTWKGTGIGYTSSAPTFTPPLMGGWVVVDTLSGQWYEWDKNNSVWREMGFRIQLTYTNGVPNYTPTKTDGFIILYETPSKGKITSHLMTATKTVEVITEGESDEQPIERVIYHMKDPIPSATKSFDNDYFTGNVLQQLHDIYLSELREYNPNIVFLSTV